MTNEITSNDIAEKFVERFRDLEEHTVSIIFRSKIPPIIKWPAQYDEKPWKAFVGHVLLPYNIFENVISPVSLATRYTIIAFWIFLFVMWSGLGHNLVETLLNGASTSSNNSTLPSDPLSIFLLRALLIIIIVFPVVAFYQLGWILFKSETKVVHKIAWFLGFLYPSYAYGVKIGLISNPSLVVSTLAEKIYLVMAYCFLIAAGIVLYVLMSVFVGTIFDVASSILGGLLRISVPVPYRFIYELITKPIRRSKNEWLFLELDKEEIAAIKRWSEKNMEINEKKTIPTLISFTLLGLLINIAPFGSLAEDLIRSLIHLMLSYFALDPKTTIIEFVGGFFAVFVLVLLIYNFAKHFRNFVIQGIITQVCIVAEYAVSKKKDASLPMQPSKLNGIIAFIIGFLVRILQR